MTLLFSSLPRIVVQRRRLSGHFSVWFLLFISLWDSLPVVFENLEYRQIWKSWLGRLSDTEPFSFCSCPELSHTSKTKKDVLNLSNQLSVLFTVLGKTCPQALVLSFVLKRTILDSFLLFCFLVGERLRYTEDLRCSSRDHCGTDSWCDNLRADWCCNNVWCWYIRNIKEAWGYRW